MGFLEPRLSLKVQQKQILTPGLVQMVSLLTLNKLELIDQIQQELVQNPVLEEGTEIVETTEAAPELDMDFDPEIETSVSAKAAEASPAAESVDVDNSDAKYAEVSEREVTLEHNADTVPTEPEIRDDPYDDIDFRSFDDYLNDSSSRPREAEVFEKPSFENFLAKPPSLTDHLEWLLGLAAVEDSVRSACHSIIGNLNEDGYLIAADENGKEAAISLEEIAESGEHTLEDVEKALAVVQRFDPPGVGARDLRECLLIQLLLLDEQGNIEEDCIAIDIVRDHLDKVKNRQYREIAKAINRSIDEVMLAIEIIKALDPRPGQKHNKTEPRHIEPDVFIVKVGDQYTVVNNEDEMPQLRLSTTYRQMLEKDAESKEVKNYVKDKFKSAVQLMKNIEQRKHIIVKVCESIVRRQLDFLDKGIDQLKPMMIKDVAEEVGVHPSTVSRAVANKYAHTAQGIFELRYFFSEAVNGPMGSETSLLIVKRKVRKFIDEEDAKAPLTDDKIAQMLKDEGISVTRRSVTKYREDLKIPSTHQRRFRS